MGVGRKVVELRDSIGTLSIMAAGLSTLGCYRFGCWCADSHSEPCAERLTSETPLRHIMSGYSERKGDSD